MISRRSILAALGFSAGAAAAAAVGIPVSAKTTVALPVYRGVPTRHVDIVYGKMKIPASIIDKWVRDDIELLDARLNGDEELELEGVVFRKRLP